MSASHTDISTRPKHTPVHVAQHTTSHKNPESQSLGMAIGSGTSLAQLMSGTGLSESRQGVPSVGTLQGTSPSLMSCHNSLSLGTLASLNMCSTPNSSAPSLLTVSLNSLSLTNHKSTSSSSSLTPPPGFSSLSSVLQISNNPLGGKSLISDSKGAPSLADLIQEHANHSPQNLSDPFSGPHSNQPIGKNTVSPTLSLSELASQHQNKKSPLDSNSQSTAEHSFSEPVTSTSLSGTFSLSQLASQHQKQSRPVLTLGTNFSSNVIKQPPSLSELLSVSDAASEHKGKTSTTSNGSQYSLTSLLSPEKPDKAGVPADTAIGGGPEHKRDHKPHCQKTPQLNQSIDLSVLISQSHEQGLGHRNSDINLPSPSSSLVGRGLDLSVFADPSLFAITLSLRNRKKHLDCTKRKILSGKTKQCAGRPKTTPTEVLPIIPFCFDTPSPDDIVRANQSKAFTR